MVNKWDKLWTGALSGFLAPLLAFLIYYQVNYPYMDVSSFVRFIVSGNVYTQLMSLCVIANLPVFFLFLQFNFYQSARGVIMLTITWAVLNFIVKLL